MDNWIKEFDKKFIPIPQTSVKTSKLVKSDTLLEESKEIKSFISKVETKAHQAGRKAFLTFMFNGGWEKLEGYFYNSSEDEWLEVAEKNFLQSLTRTKR